MGVIDGVLGTRLHTRFEPAEHEDTLDELVLAEIARLLTLEQGKPLPDSEKEILFGATVLDYYAEQGSRVHGSLRPNASAATTSTDGRLSSRRKPRWGNQPNTARPSPAMAITVHPVIRPHPTGHSTAAPRTSGRLLW